MNVFRLRFFRQKRCILFTGVVIVLFLMYQLISVGQLGKELSRRNHKSKLQTNFRSYEKADGFMQPKVSEKDILPQNPDVEETIKFILGVLPSSQKFYKPTVRNTFRCLRSGEEFDYSFLNDNFCDCTDLSDEPSTSACSTGRFYCTHQSKKNINSIMSYKVNDGICDCCDGSDEWLNVKLPEHSQIPANKQKGIFQVPCPVKCIS